MSIDVTRQVGETTRVIMPFEPNTEPARRPWATAEHTLVDPAPAAPASTLARRSVPYTLPEGWAWTGPKHRRPTSLFQQLFGGAR